MRDGATALVLLACLGLVGAAEAPAAAEGAAADRVHVVKTGETLWQIAAGLTGDPHRWPELYRANRDQIKDPSTLYPGQRLAIPDFDEPPGEVPPAPLPGATAGRSPSRPREAGGTPSADP